MPCRSVRFRHAVKSIKSVSSNLVMFYDSDVFSGGDMTLDDLNVLLSLNDQLRDAINEIDHVARFRISQLPRLDEV